MAKPIIDFRETEISRGVYYGGDAGAKDAVLYNGDAWMLKYPKNTRDLEDPQVSCTTSPLSEYLGSCIYALAGIPVHETLLGVRNNRVVVACKDFTRVRNAGQTQGFGRLAPDRLLVPFHDLKNSFMSSDLESYSGTGSETLLDEVLATIHGLDILQSIPGVLTRFWDMFVVDAFIGNNDRNNGNWGILIDTANGEASLAPVFDNGDAFFNKRSLAQMAKRLEDERSLREDALHTTLSAYKYTGLDKEGHRINPFDYISQGENPDCLAAVLRFVETLDFSAVEDMLRHIPEAFGNLAVMPEVQKEFYLALMRIRLNEGFLPMVRGQGVSQV